MPKGYSKHNQGGWKHSPESKAQMSESSKGIAANEKNPRWMGNKVSYGALHTWIREHLGTPSVCTSCGRNGLSKQQIHWANISKEYKRDATDWMRLCAKCHKAFDKGTTAKLKRKRRKI